MTPASAGVMKAVGAVIALILQVALAPNIALFGSFPCIPLVYVMALGVADPANASIALSFLTGLACDLLGSGPVGALAFLFLLAHVATARVFLVLDNDALFMPFAIMFAGMFAVETLYGFLLVALGLPVSLLDAFLNRAAPCALYDCVVAVIVYPLLVVLFSRTAKELKIRTPKLR
ncbi:rod shape-determining protein MreD [Adlercreutzia sp. ZJ141]|uniref:rod shape-determining protein MreD n=1 Tax=Adlercreutzia sp. ZJ141 TaxID=2709406 RepID=UPI0013EA22E7|nr:rod shape-determining protein MreD [Adlercreutzia sp. ZJ141]